MIKLSISNTSLECISFPVGPLGCNFSLIWDPTTLDAIAVDPGGDFERIANEIESRKLTVKQIVHTHAHFDHLGASGDLHRKTQAPLALHAGDDFLWKNVKMQGGFFSIPLENPPPFQKSLVDDETLAIGSQSLRCLHTPGHTPGSMCFVIEDLLFSGDTLFQNSIGRTDLWGGDSDLIAKSIKQRLYTLDRDTRVICGHGPQTQIGFEKKNNPFVSG